MGTFLNFWVAVAQRSTLASFAGMTMTFDLWLTTLRQRRWSFINSQLLGEYEKIRYSMSSFLEKVLSLRLNMKWSFLHLTFYF